MATLKISDLSVGDWVQNNYGDYVKVAGTWQGCNFNYQVDILRDGRIGTIVPCNIHPIPITPEMLEANGFEKIRENVYFDSYCWTNKKDTMIEMCHCKEIYNVKIVQLVDGLQKDRFCNLGILFVHQLQHILRLAGVEKEITMPNK